MKGTTDLRNLGTRVAAFAMVVLPALGSAAEPAALEVRHVMSAAADWGAVEQSERDIPVVGQADVVVAGGGVAGVVAALEAARSGLSVVLLEPRNQLGHEWTATYQCQTAAGEPPASTPLARAVFGDLTAKRVWVGQRVDPHGLRSYLHAQVAGQPRLTTYLFSMPVGVVCQGNRVRGVVFVSHNGRQAVLAETVVDATPDARIAVAAGARLARSLPGTKTVRRFMAVARAASLPTGPRSMPSTLGLIGNAIQVHEGFLEFSVRAEIGAELDRDLSAINATTLAKCFAIREALAVEGIQLDNLAASPEPWIDEMPVVVCRAQRSPQEIAAGDFSRPGLLLPADVEGCVVTGRIVDARPEMGALPTLLAVGNAAGLVAADLSRQTGRSGRAGGRADSARPLLSAQDISLPPDVPAGGSLVGPPTTGPQIRELLDGIEAGRSYPTIRQRAVPLPIRGRYDVLVVGGGTSGAVAAIAAARQGARVAVVEILPNLGGTSSNRVHGYYWGAPWKSLLRQELGDRIRLTKSTGTGPLEKVRFSGEDKKYALQELALQAGVVIYYQSIATGAVVDGRRVTGAVIENAAGRHVLLAHVLIDATGHADLALAAGATPLKGRGTDGFLLELEHGPLRDPAHPGDISVPYLQTPSAAVSLNIRESRRVLGDYVVTFDDAIHERLFPDTICRWRSNYDTHFPNSASQSELAQDWTALLGLWRRPILGSIPYRCLLPQGLEQILVAAKAYSTDHDALIGGRMQPDLEHLGEAAGVAAALACRLDVPPREVPVDRLQAELVRLGVLRAADVPGPLAIEGPSPEDLHRQDLWRTEREQQFPPSATPLTLEAAAARLGTEHALDGMVRLYLAGDDARPWLRPLLDSDKRAAREEAALLLGILGDRAAAPQLMELLQQRNPRRFTFQLPQASSRPSVPLYWSAVILLGRLSEQRAVPELLALLALLGNPPPADYGELRRTNYNSDQFEHPEHCPPPLASFIIVALGRIGDPQAASAVRPFLGVAARVGVRQENTDFEIAWAIRTHAAQALARMGDLSGVPVLVELLEADQALLREYARRLLEDITGQQLGPDPAPWRVWWEQQSNSP